MPPRLVTFVVTTVLACAAIVGAEAPATASGACSMYVPSRVAINKSYRAVPVKFGDNCVRNALYASWDAYHPTRGWLWWANYRGRTTQAWELYDFAPTGRWRWEPSGAITSGYAYDIYQYGPYYTEVRYASSALITAHRIGRRVTLRTYARRYAASVHRYVRWAGARGVIQRRVPGTSIWRNLKSVTSNSTGAYSYRLRTRARQDYRVVIFNTPTSLIWGSTSASARR